MTLAAGTRLGPYAIASPMLLVLEWWSELRRLVPVG